VEEEAEETEKEDESEGERVAKASGGIEAL